MKYAKQSQNTSKIAVIGGGAGGAMCIINLINYIKKNKIKKNFNLIIFEKDKTIGPGLPYKKSTTNKFFLNAVAWETSIIISKNNDYVKWLKKNYPQKKNLDPQYSYKNQLTQRYIFGNYIKDRFKEYCKKLPKNISVKIIHENVIDIDIFKNHYQLKTNKNNLYKCNKIVLATGFTKPKNIVKSLQKLPDNLYCKEPYKVTKNIITKNDRDILFLGSSLTMVDICANLYYQDHQKKLKFTAISRHGLLPTTLKPEYYDIYKPAKIYKYKKNIPKNLLPIVKKVNSMLKNRKKYHWMEMRLGLLRISAYIWKTYSPLEKKKFARLFGTYWMKLKALCAYQTMKKIDTIQSENKLNILAGRLISIKIIKENKKSKLKVNFYNKKWHKYTSMKFDKVINTTNYKISLNDLSEPLTKSMVKKKILLPNFISGLGPIITNKLTLKNNIHYAKNIFVIGPGLADKFDGSYGIINIKQHLEKILPIITK